MRSAHGLKRRARRRDAVKQARDTCRSARLELREKQRAARLELREKQRAARLAARASCHECKDAASVAGTREIELRKQALRAEAKEQRVIDMAGRAPRARSTSKERAQESDDAVRSNLPPELVPVFNRVRRDMKATARRSRTEAFLEWAEENPGEVVGIQQADADRHLTKLLAEHHAHEKAMRKTKRHDPEVRKRLADVPF